MLVHVVTDGVDRPEDAGVPTRGARTGDASAVSGMRAANDESGALQDETRIETRRAARARAAAQSASRAAAGPPPAPPAEPHGPPAPSTEVIQTVQRRQWTRGLLVLAASFILLIALGFGAARLGGLLFDPQPPAIVALEHIEAAPDAQSSSAVVAGGGEATAHWSESLGTAVLVVQDLPALDDGQAYVMWFVRGEASVAAGVLEPDDTGSATALLSGDLAPDDAIAVTVEPSGGSSAGGPSSDPIVVIPTS